jgi:hypothetical protein
MFKKFPLFVISITFSVYYNAYLSVSYCTQQPHRLPTQEFAAEIHLLKLQHLQNKVLRTTGNHPRHALVRDTHVAFQIPNVYNYKTKLCTRQAEIIHNHENENENVCNIGQGESPHRKYTRLKLGGSHLYDHSSV